MRCEPDPVSTTAEVSDSTVSGGWGGQEASVLRPVSSLDPGAALEFHGLHRAWAKQPWARYLKSLCLNFLTHKAVKYLTERVVFKIQ